MVDFAILIYIVLLCWIGLFYIRLDPTHTHTHIYIYMYMYYIYTYIIIYTYIDVCMHLATYGHRISHAQPSRRLDHLGRPTRTGEPRPLISSLSWQYVGLSAQSRV